MKIKKILILFVCAFILFGLYGCGTKEAVSFDEFKEIMGKYNYTFDDSTYEYKESLINSGIQNFIIAKKDDNNKIAYYEFDTNERALQIYNQTVDAFTSGLEGASKTTKESGNYRSTSIISEGNHYYIAQIDNTLIQLTSKESTKDEDEKFIKALGY